MWSGMSHSSDDLGADVLNETAALTGPDDLFTPAIVGTDVKRVRLEALSQRLSGAGKRPRGKQQDSYWWTSLVLAVQYVRSGIHRDTHSFCVGLMTVALVVAFTGLVQSAVDNSQVIFLKLSEDTAGEGDVVLLPDFDNAASALSGTGTGSNASLLPSGLLLNDTDLRQRLMAVPAVQGVSPRWTALGRVLNTRARALNTSAILLVIDSDQEAAIGLGRSWNRRALGAAEAYVSISALDEIGVAGAVGEQVDVEVPLATVLSATGAGGGGGDAADGTGSAEQLLDLLASLGFDIGTPDGQGGRSLPVDVDQLIEAGLSIPAFSGLPIDPALLPPLGTVSINITQVLQAALDGGGGQGGAAGAAAAGLGNALTLSKTVTVVEGIAAPAGKWPAVLGNAVVLEGRHVATWLGEAVAAAADQILAVLGPLEPAIRAAGGPTAAIGALRSFRDGAAAFRFADMRQYALLEYVVLRDRMELYIGRPGDVDQGIARFADDITAALGVAYPASVTKPLPEALSSIRFIKLFLDQVFGTVVFILGLLGSLVIFALVLGNVEEKTYEYGMLRALGLRQRTLIKLLGVSSASFSGPGIVLGLIGASVLHAGLLLTFYLLTNTVLSPTLSAGGWLIGILLGIAMPSVANVVPIRRALTSTLRDSLDLYHQTINQVTVTLRRLADVGISATESTIALVLVLVGFTTFYVLPLSFATGQFSIFLAILSVVLVGMLLGLSVLGATVQPAFETALSTGLLSCRSASRLATVVVKSLAAHRRRNSKTAYMVSMSTAFIIFAGAMFALQAESISSNFRLFLGADLVVFAPAQSGTGDAGVASQQAPILPQAALTAYLSAEVARSRAVADRAPTGTLPSQLGATVAGFSYISQRLDRLFPIYRTRLAPLTLDPSRSATVTGLQRNYLDVVFPEFTVVTEVPPGAAGVAPDAIIQALHDEKGTLRLPIDARTDAFLPSVTELLSMPRLAPVYGCGVSDWEEAAAAGGSDVTYSSWRACDSACSSACAELPVVNRTLSNAAAAMVYQQYVDAIASEAVRDTLSISTSLAATLRTNALDASSGRITQDTQLVKLRAVVSKMAGFFFSPYSQLANGAPLLVPAQAVAQAVDGAAAQLAELDSDASRADWGNAFPPLPFVTQRLQRKQLDGSISSDDPARNIAYPAEPGAWISGAGLGWATADGNGPLLVPDALADGGNASVAVDGAAATSVFVPVRAPGGSGEASLRLHLSPACPTVGGVRLWVPAAEMRQGRQAERVRVEAAASASPARWTTVAEASLLHSPAEPAPGATGEWATLTWPQPLAAPHWRVVFVGVSAGAAGVPPAPSAAAASALQLSEVQLLASRGFGECTVEVQAAAADDSSPSVAKERLMVRLYEGTSGRQRSNVVNALRNLLLDDSFRVEDTAELLLAASTAIDGLNAFFYIVAALCLVLCFFAVWLSFEANIREHSREIGIMRALGLTKPNLRLLVVVEALGVVIAAFVEGSAIGMAISISLTLQFNLFTQLPFVFRFPTGLFVSTFVACMLVAVAGSLLPLRRFLSAAIAPVAKGRLK